MVGIGVLKRCCGWFRSCKNYFFSPLYDVDVGEVVGLHTYWNG